MGPLGVPLARCAQAEDLVPPLVQTVSPVAAQVSVSRATCALRAPRTPRQCCVLLARIRWPLLGPAQTVQLGCTVATPGRHRRRVRARASPGTRVQQGPPTPQQWCVGRVSTAWQELVCAPTAVLAPMAASRD